MATVSEGPVCASMRVGFHCSTAVCFRGLLVAAMYTLDVYAIMQPVHDEMPVVIKIIAQLLYAL